MTTPTLQARDGRPRRAATATALSLELAVVGVAATATGLSHRQPGVRPEGDDATVVTIDLEQPQPAITAAASNMAEVVASHS